MSDKSVKQKAVDANQLNDEIKELVNIHSSYFYTLGEKLYRMRVSGAFKYVLGYDQAEFYDYCQYEVGRDQFYVGCIVRIYDALGKTLGFERADLRGLKFRELYKLTQMAEQYILATKRKPYEKWTPLPKVEEPQLSHYRGKIEEAIQDYRAL